MVLSYKQLFDVIIMSKINVAEIMTQKFALELNAALAMENAGIERLQTGLVKPFCQRPSNKCSTISRKA